MVIRGVLNYFANPRLGLQKATKKNSLLFKTLKIQLNIEKVARANPRLAQIAKTNPRYIWGSGVFNTPLMMMINDHQL